MYTVKIANVDKTSLVKRGSISVIKGADNRSDCSLSLLVAASAMGNPDAYQGKDLKIYDGEDVVFGGVIKTAGITKWEPGIGSGVLLKVDVYSNGYCDIPSRRTTSSTYSDTTAGAIVSSMITDVLNATGYDDDITAGTISDGIDLTAYSAVCKSVKDVLDELAEASGYKWYIDDTKTLNFVAEDSVSDAAHDIIEGGAFTDYCVDSLDASMENYCNKVFVRGATVDDVIVEVAVSDTTEIAARAAAEGGSGVYGKVIEDPSIETTDDATTVANNELKKYGVIPYILTFTSYTNDWQAGTKLKVNLPSYGLSSDTYFLIESVEVEDIDGITLRSTVTATRRKTASFSTQRTDGFVEYFGKLVRAAKLGNIDNLTNVGGTGEIPVSLDDLSDVNLSAGVSAYGALTYDTTIDPPTGKWRCLGIDRLYTYEWLNASQIIASTETELIATGAISNAGIYAQNDLFNVLFFATVRMTASESLKAKLYIKVKTGSGAYTIHAPEMEKIFWAAGEETMQIACRIPIKDDTRYIRLYASCDQGTVTIDANDARAFVAIKGCNFESEEI